MEDIKILEKWIKELLEEDKEAKLKLWINDDKKIISFKAIQNLIARYKELEKENKKLKELIGTVRKLSNGVVNYIDYSSDILGPRKNYSKQELYRDFKTIQELLKSNYIFLTTEKFLQELLEEFEETGNHIPRID